MMNGQEIQQAFDVWEPTLTDDDKIACADKILSTRLLVEKLALALQSDHLIALPASLVKRLDHLTIRFKQELSKIGGDVFKVVDDLYCFCLQYGIVGLSKDDTITKVSADKIAAVAAMKAAATDVVEHISVAKQQVDQAAVTQVERLRSEADVHIESLKTTIEKMREVADQTITAAKEETQNRSQSVTQELATLATTTQQKVTEIEGLIKKCQADAVATENAVKEAQTLQGDIAKTKVTVDKQQSEVTTSLANANLTCDKLDGILKTGRESESEVKAKLDEATKAWASIKEHQASIDGFNSNLEKYKSNMAAAQRESDAHHRQLVIDTDSTIKKFTEETRQIIDSNKKNQEETAKILGDATTAGLFNEFNKRAVKLSSARKKWENVIWLLIVSTTVLIGYLIYAQTRNADWGATFFLRLSITLPLAAAFYFAGSQFAKERRLEEEYAFKATISQSLNPYRKLLVELRGVEGGEVEFVRHLMLEAFKNPARFVYHMDGQESSSNGEAWSAEAPADKISEIRGKSVTPESAG